MIDATWLPIFQVDAFTDQLYSGNPAAVCLLSEQGDPKWMQSVAIEMNLSETAFVIAKEAGYELRWFTPTTEVDLCGHGTLAAAHILWEQGMLQAESEAHFHTRSGLLRARRTEQFIELDFPAIPAEPAPCPKNLLAALGINNGEILRSSFDYLVRVPSEYTLRSVTPDFPTLRNIPTRGVIVTAESESTRYDFVSRFFAPAAGINEDPVTGSAHCTLAPYWSEQLKKQEMTAFQSSQRGGVVHLRLAGNRVILGGRAVTVISGHLHG